jgi:hypothetical protein
VPKSAEKSHEGKETVLQDHQVKTDRTIRNKKPQAAVRDIEKGTCLLTLQFQDT